MKFNAYQLNELFEATKHANLDGAVRFTISIKTKAESEAKDMLVARLKVSGFKIQEHTTLEIIDQGLIYLDIL